jgi:hypothetical protein
MHLTVIIKYGLIGGRSVELGSVTSNLNLIYLSIKLESFDVIKIVKVLPYFIMYAKE